MLLAGIGERDISTGGWLMMTHKKSRRGVLE
jgi:hypothetical protein